VDELCLFMNIMCGASGVYTVVASNGVRWMVHIGMIDERYIAPVAKSQGHSARLTRFSGRRHY